MSLLLPLLLPALAAPRPVEARWEITATAPGDPSTQRAVLHPARSPGPGSDPAWSGWYDVPAGWRWLGPSVTWTIRTRGWTTGDYAAACPSEDGRACLGRSVRAYGRSAEPPRQVLQTPPAPTATSRAYHTPGHYIIRARWRGATAGGEKAPRAAVHADLYVVANDQDRRTEVICAPADFPFPTTRALGLRRVEWTITWESDVDFAGCGAGEELLALDVGLRAPTP